MHASPTNEYYGYVPYESYIIQCIVITFMTSKTILYIYNIVLLYLSCSINLSRLSLSKTKYEDSKILKYNRIHEICIRSNSIFIYWYRIKKKTKSPNETWRDKLSLENTRCNHKTYNYEFNSYEEGVSCEIYILLV